MQALKFLVVFMAVLIVAAVAVIVVTLFNRSSRPSYSAGQPIPQMPVDLPGGSQVVAMTASGDRLAVHVRDAAGLDHVILIDMRNGAPVSDLRFERR
ncbi:MAG: DUF6476 family protein [Alphaproteobacteria bacterium]